MPDKREEQCNDTQVFHLITRFLATGAGPEGGNVIFEGTPEDLAGTSTPTAPYLLDVLS